MPTSAANVSSGSSDSTCRLDIMLADCAARSLSVLVYFKHLFPVFILIFLCSLYATQYVISVETVLELHNSAMHYYRDQNDAVAGAHYQ